jgi:hypothetical protein
MRTRNQRQPVVSPKGWYKVSGHPINGRRRTGLRYAGTGQSVCIHVQMSLAIASAVSGGTVCPKRRTGEFQESVWLMVKSRDSPSRSNGKRTGRSYTDSALVRTPSSKRWGCRDRGSNLCVNWSAVLGLNTGQAIAGNGGDDVFGVRTTLGGQLISGTRIQR